MEKRRQELLAKFDTDGDGQLNEEERKAAGEALRQRIHDRRGEGEGPGGPRRGPGGGPRRGPGGGQ